LIRHFIFVFPDSVGNVGEREIDRWYSLRDIQYNTLAVLRLPFTLQSFDILVHRRDGLEDLALTREAEATRPELTGTGEMIYIRAYAPTSAVPHDMTVTWVAGRDMASVPYGIPLATATKKKILTSYG
jgi:hypothetical protein